MTRIGAFISIVALALAPCSIATSQDLGWRDKDGNAAPDTDARKSSKDFAGWLFTTSDPDWEAKWNTPEHETPKFTEAETVRRGETIYTLIFIVNPKPDAKGEVNVSCDLKVTRPDGTTSIDEKNVDCLKGQLPGNPHNMRLAEPVLGFVGEPADPAGTWRVDVILRDVPRGVTMDLHSSFELLDGADAKASSRHGPRTQRLRPWRWNAAARASAPFDGVTTAASTPR